MSVYEIITNMFIEKLEKGVVPWKKNWSTVSDFPRNFLSKKSYSGINLFLLMMFFQKPNFLTFKQVQKLGGKIRKGAKSAVIIYWSKTWKDEKGKHWKKFVPGSKVVMALRYYRVFNESDIEGIDFGESGEAVREVSEEVKNLGCMEIVTRTGVTVKSGEPAYNPLTDIITMPDTSSFVSDDAYWCTMFHELIHWTGAKGRLDRLKKEDFTSDGYAKEELVAELGAAFLCAEMGIDNDDVTENSAAYLNGWIKRLKGNSKLLIGACSSASKATKLLTGEELCV